MHNVLQYVSPNQAGITVTAHAQSYVCAVLRKMRMEVDVKAKSTDDECSQSDDVSSENVIPITSSPSTF